MALRLNGNFWGRWTQKLCLPEIDALHEMLFKHILPALPDPLQEADAHEQAAWNGLIFQPPWGDGDGDLCALAEWASEKGFERYERISSMRQTAINMGAVMLWHLLEQQILFFHRRQLLSIGEEQDVRHNPKLKYNKLCVFEKRLMDRGYDLSLLSSWSKVSELALVANTIKHAAGDSAHKLHKLRPDLFTPPSLKYSGGLFETNPADVERPAAGDGLYVTEHDLLDYFNKATAFWVEFSGIIKA